MPARYTLTSPPDAVRAWFGYKSQDTFPPRYNIAPTQPVAIVCQDLHGDRAFRLVRWGLIPSWAKQPEKFSTLITARAETAAQKPSFRAALRHRRCLIPADGFYAWAGSTNDKHPYFVHRADRTIMAFAGLSEHWLGADGSELETMAILTIAASANLHRIEQDRMPLTLEPEHFDVWLDCSSGSASDVVSLLEHPARPELEFFEVSRQVNNPRNDFADIMRPVS